VQDEIDISIAVNIADCHSLFAKVEEQAHAGPGAGAFLEENHHFARRSNDDINEVVPVEISRLDVFAPAADCTDFPTLPAGTVGRVTIRPRVLEPDEIDSIGPIGRDDVAITVPIDVGKHSVGGELDAGPRDYGVNQIGPPPPRHRILGEAAKNEI
jgi:hypothetical protein